MNTEFFSGLLHGLLLNEDAAEGFVTLLHGIAGLQKERLVGLLAHDYLLANLSSIFLAESGHYVALRQMAPRAKCGV